MGGGKGSQVQDVDMDQLVRTSALVNRPDVYNPYGSSVWSGDPENMQQTQTFNPETQALYEGQLDYMGQGPSQFQSQQLPPWMQSMGGQVLGRVGNRFGMDIDQGESLKPQQQMPNAPAAIDMAAIRAGAGQTPGPAPPGGTGAAVGGYGNSGRPPNQRP